MSNIDINILIIYTMNILYSNIDIKHLSNTLLSSNSYFIWFPTYYVEFWLKILTWKSIWWCPTPYFHLTPRIILLRALLYTSMHVNFQLPTTLIFEDNTRVILYCQCYVILTNYNVRVLLFILKNNKKRKSLEKRKKKTIYHIVLANITWQWHHNITPKWCPIFDMDIFSLHHNISHLLLEDFLFT